MEDYPTEIELNVASALLLLSNPSSASPPLYQLRKEEAFKELTKRSVVINKTQEKKKKISDTTSLTTPTNVSTLTVADNDDDEEDSSIESRRFKLMAAAASRFRDLKLKVAKRARSKVIYKSTIERKPAGTSWAKPPTVEPESAGCSQEERTTSTTEGSCLTNGGSSEISSGKKVRGNSSWYTRGVEQKMRRRVGSAHIRRRAEAIMRLLSRRGSASEVRIRQFLGDSPDTSKALRMLLKLEEVKRSGAGGRADPFIYAIAAPDQRSMTA